MGESIQPSTFLKGMLAGYGIALPLGAIAVLIVDTALRYGFGRGALAGGGAASADLFYAGAAALAGPAAARILAPYAFQMRLAGGLVLILIGLLGARRALAKAGEQTTPWLSGEGGAGARTYAQFLGLTLLNPLTVAYFAALVMSCERALSTPGESLSFVLGVGLASLSWQTLLAAAGALARRRASARAGVVATLAGNGIVLALGARALWQLFV